MRHTKNRTKDVRCDTREQWELWERRESVVSNWASPVPYSLLFLCASEPNIDKTFHLLEENGNLGFYEINSGFYLLATNPNLFFFFKFIVYQVKNIKGLDLIHGSSALLPNFRAKLCLLVFMLSFEVFSNSNFVLGKLWPLSTGSQVMTPPLHFLVMSAPGSHALYTLKS